MIDTTTIAKIMREEVIKEWQAQGHSLTGAFERGLITREERGVDSIKIQLIDTTDQGYGAIIDKGVKAENIPFTPGSRRRGGTSKYIQGLIAYAKTRMGASDKDAISIAFAIAHKHAKEGMPTEKSKQFSSTGFRTQFIQAADKRIREILNKEIKQQIEDNVNNTNNNT